MQAPGPILSTRETNCLDLPGPLCSPSASRPTAFAMTRRSLSLFRTMSDLIVRRIVQGARPGPSGRRQRLEQSRQPVYVEQQGCYSEAEPLVRGCLAIKEKVLGPDHPDVALSLNNLTDLLYAWMRPAQAVSFFERALATLANAVQILLSMSPPEKEEATDSPTCSS
jgi:Tetratricopeptide repeat